KSDEVEIDLNQEVPDAVEVSVEDESMQPDAKNTIGCYFSPGNAVFYVRLTETLESVDDADDLHAEERGEIYSLHGEESFDEVVYDSSDDKDAPAAQAVGELVNIDLMLAEVSFIDGNELLAKGDLTGAILHFRDALNYAPGIPDYHLKLADVLGGNPETRKEAKQMLVKAMKLWPKNSDLREKFEELRKPLKRSKRKQGAARTRQNRRPPKKTKRAGRRKVSELDTTKLIEELAEWERRAAAEMLKKGGKRRLLSRRISRKLFMTADKMLPNK